MAISLASIQQTKHASPPRIVVHGVEKVGKSSFFAQSPSPIFVQTEDGLNGIEANAFPLATSLQDVLDALTALTAEQHQFQTVVIDSGDWLERLIHQQVCKDDNVDIIEKAGGGYGKGYLVALNHWRGILSKLDFLNKSKKMGVGIICHSRVTQYNDPMHEPYDVFRMKLHSPKSGNGACELLQEWADVIGFASKNMLIQKRKVSGGKTDKDGNAETVARGLIVGESNKLHLQGSPAHK